MLIIIVYLILKLKSFAHENHSTCQQREIHKHIHKFVTLRKKCSYLELFWSAFSRIWTEYVETQSISTYSVGMRENTDQNNSEYEHFSRSEILYIMKSINHKFNRIKGLRGKRFKNTKYLLNNFKTTTVRRSIYCLSKLFMCLCLLWNHKCLLFRNKRETSLKYK